MKIRLIVSVLLIVMLSQKLFAQQNQPSYQFELDRATNAYNAKKYNTAAGLYKKVYPKIKDTEQKQKVLFYIAESYRLGNNYAQGIVVFSVACTY